MQIVQSFGLLKLHKVGEKYGRNYNKSYGHTSEMS